MLAVQTVHTSGINIESLATILAGFAAVVGVLLSYVNRRQNKRDAIHEREQLQRDKEMQELRQDFTIAVSHLGETLSAKLETKEAVSAISMRLARVEGVIGRNISSGTPQT